MQYFYASAGHITIRDPVEPDTFLMNPFGLHFSLMTASDILRVNHDGDVLDGGKPDRRYCNRAGFLIHAAVHEARPEANAVVHSHSPYSKAWCTFNADLPLLTQDSSTFYKDLAVDQEFSGVALDPDEGRRIAKGLGNNKAALLGVSVSLLFDLVCPDRFTFLRITGPSLLETASKAPWRTSSSSRKNAK